MEAAGWPCRYQSIYELAGAPPYHPYKACPFHLTGGHTETQTREGSNREREVESLHAHCFGTRGEDACARWPVTSAFGKRARALRRRRRQGGDDAVPAHCYPVSVSCLHAQDWCSIVHGARKQYATSLIILDHVVWWPRLQHLIRGISRAVTPSTCCQCHAGRPRLVGHSPFIMTPPTSAHPRRQCHLPLIHCQASWGEHWSAIARCPHAVDKSGHDSFSSSGVGRRAVHPRRFESSSCQQLQYHTHRPRPLGDKMFICTPLSTTTSDSSPSPVILLDPHIFILFYFPGRRDENLIFLSKQINKALYVFGGGIRLCLGANSMPLFCCVFPPHLGDWVQRHRS